MTATALESKPPLPAGRTSFLRKSGRTLPPSSTSVSTRGSGWAAEVAGLPAQSLFELPLPPALALHVPGIERAIRFTVHPERDEAPRIGFDRDEWRALVIATEADRFWPDDLVELCHRKEADPTFRVELAHALAGGQPDPSERWNVSRVLTRWGVRRLSVELASVDDHG